MDFDATISEIKEHQGIESAIWFLLYLNMKGRDIRKSFAQLDNYGFIVADKPEVVYRDLCNRILRVPDDYTAVSTETINGIYRECIFATECNYPLNVKVSEFPWYCLSAILLSQTCFSIQKVSLYMQQFAYYVTFNRGLKLDVQLARYTSSTVQKLRSLKNINRAEFNGDVNIPASLHIAYPHYYLRSEQVKLHPDLLHDAEAYNVVMLIVFVNTLVELTGGNLSKVNCIQRINKAYVKNFMPNRILLNEIDTWKTMSSKQIHDRLEVLLLQVNSRLLKKDPMRAITQVLQSGKRDC